MKEVIIFYKNLITFISNFIRIRPKKFNQDHFFEGWSWLEFSNLGLVLGMALKFHIYLAKMLKLKIKKFSELIVTFPEITWEKLENW